MQSADTMPKNRLLEALPRSVRSAFLAECSTVELVYGSVLYDENDPIEYVHFPTTAFVSMLKTVGGNALEVGMIGNEGVCGCQLILGVRTAQLRAVTQGAGSAWRMSTAAFLRHVEKMPALRAVLHRYLDILIRQLAQTAACNRFHVVEMRLARWLLMTQDRAHASSFDITQEFLASMLGVRRGGVTVAAGALQSRDLISYKRGTLAILSRDLLEATACTCYGADLATYLHGMSSSRGRHHSSAQ
jgi:CRP-like cAMP-binding protein